MAPVKLSVWTDAQYWARKKGALLKKRARLSGFGREPAKSLC